MAPAVIAEGRSMIDCYTPGSTTAGLKSARQVHASHTAATRQLPSPPTDSWRLSAHPLLLAQASSRQRLPGQG